MKIKARQLLMPIKVAKEAGEAQRALPHAPRPKGPGPDAFQHGGIRGSKMPVLSILAPPLPTEGTTPPIISIFSPPRPTEGTTPPIISIFSPPRPTEGTTPPNI